MFIPTQVLPEVEQLLTSTMILCGWRTREVKVQRGGSCLLWSVQCNHLPKCLKELHVKWFTDSQAAAKIVKVDSMKLGLNKMAQRIFDICIWSGIQLDVQWISRTSHQQADYISHLIDTDDWQITVEFFFFFLMACGARIAKIALQTIIIISSPIISRGFGTPIPQVLIFFFQSLQGGNCLVAPPVGIIPPVYIIWNLSRPLVCLLYLFGLWLISGL